MDSILTSVKKMLGIETEYEHFDADILMHINSVFSVLNAVRRWSSVWLHGHR